MICTCPRHKHNINSIFLQQIYDIFNLTLNNTCTSYSKTIVDFVFRCSICWSRLSNNFLHSSQARICGSPSVLNREFKLELLPERFRKPVSRPPSKLNDGLVSFSMKTVKVNCYICTFSYSYSSYRVIPKQFLISVLNKTRMSIGHRCPHFFTFVTKFSDGWTDKQGQI